MRLEFEKPFKFNKPWASIWMKSVEQIKVRKPGPDVLCAHPRRFSAHFTDQPTIDTFPGPVIETVQWQQYIMPLTGATWLMAKCSCGKLYYFTVDY